jgi:hypothetical protein
MTAIGEKRVERWVANVFKDAEDAEKPNVER